MKARKPELAADADNLDAAIRPPARLALLSHRSHCIVARAATTSIFADLPPVPRDDDRRGYSRTDQHLSRRHFLRYMKSNLSQATGGDDLSNKSLIRRFFC
jgi:hypothetical protein